MRCRWCQSWRCRYFPFLDVNLAQPSAFIIHPAQNLEQRAPICGWPGIAKLQLPPAHRLETQDLKAPLYSRLNLPITAGPVDLSNGGLLTLLTGYVGEEESNVFGGLPTVPTEDVREEKDRGGWISTPNPLEKSCCQRSLAASFSSLPLHW